MRIVMTGASGFVGTSLLRGLVEDGHEVIRLVRRAPRTADEVRWDPTASGVAGLDPSELGKVDAALHLAGENIAGARWSATVKKRLLDSRVKGTELLARTLAGLPEAPRVLVSASATGYYGDCGAEILTETSPRVDDFLSGVCAAWEEACEPARAAGIRVVNLRMGMVLGKGGGALQRMLLPFRLCAGGVLGSGAQYMSWISLPDLVAVMRFALGESSLDGPVNAVAPTPVTNREFTQTLGRVLRRPTILPMPAFAARLAFGEMADALLLVSHRVVPGRLLESGFEFEHSELEVALRHVLQA